MLSKLSFVLSVFQVASIAYGAAISRNAQIMSIPISKAAFNNAYGSKSHRYLKQGSEINVQQTGFKDTFYFSEIALGTPGQTFKVTRDQFVLTKLSVLNRNCCAGPV